MPLYEYQCVEGHVTERFRLMECRDSPVDCAHCGRLALRQLSVPAVRIVDRPPGFWRRDRDCGPSSGPAIHTWDSERRFPNLRKEGDGAMSFPTASCA